MPYGIQRLDGVPYLKKNDKFEGFKNVLTVL